MYLFCAVMLHFSSFSFIKAASKNVLKPIDESDRIQDNIVQTVSENKKTSIIIEQFYIAKHLKSYYMGLATSYYQNYYVFTICSVIYTIFLTVNVFLIGENGWHNSSINLKVFTLLTINFAALYFFLPNVLNNKLNLQKNMSGVKVFKKIQFDILSFMNTIDRHDETEANIFISNIYASIKENYDYNISFDTSLLSSNPLNNFKNLKDG